ncbi:MAG: cytochrome c-type biogenesis protein CcmH [Actinomycetia bacterium]|nr:cytochrome c-type biogenesis protein CcmH [Actinomycetes bacterium]
MTDRTKNLIFGAIGALALVVIVAGLASGDSTPPTDAERVDTLASAIKCPFCNGESLKESQSSVAAEYRALIAQRVADGATDDEVIDEFAAKFGDSYILDTSTTSWSIALWIVPILAIAIGAGVVTWMYRSARRRSEVVR